MHPPHPPPWIRHWAVLSVYLYVYFRLLRSLHCVEMRYYQTIFTRI